MIIGGAGLMMILEPVLLLWCSFYRVILIKADINSESTECHMQNVLLVKNGWTSCFCNISECQRLKLIEWNNQVNQGDFAGKCCHSPKHGNVVICPCYILDDFGHCIKFSYSRRCLTAWNLEKIFHCMALAWKTKWKSKCPLLQSFHFNRRSVWDLFQVEKKSLPEWCSLQVEVPAQMHNIYWSNCSCQADHSFNPTLRMQEFREMVSKCNNRFGTYTESLIKEMEKLYITNRNKPQAPIHTALYLQHTKPESRAVWIDCKSYLTTCQTKSVLRDPPLLTLIYTLLLRPTPERLALMRRR